MKYINAKELLPDTLIRELQKYIQGGYLYVPTAPERQKRWGEVSGYREELDKRNCQIALEYRKGESLEHLAERYSLSVSAIRKIIYQK